MTRQASFFATARGLDQAGCPIEVRIYRQGGHWWLHGPTVELAHPSRRDLTGALREVGMVFLLDDVQLVAA